MGGLRGERPEKTEKVLLYYIIVNFKWILTLLITLYIYAYIIFVVWINVKVFKVSDSLVIIPTYNEKENIEAIVRVIFDLPIV